MVTDLRAQNASAGRSKKCPKMSKKFSHVFINQKFQNESIMLQSHFLDTFSEPGKANAILDILEMSNLFF